MKVTLPNGAVIEGTLAEIVEAHNSIKSADATLKTVFGDDAISFWDIFKGWAKL